MYIEVSESHGEKSRVYVIIRAGPTIKKKKKKLKCSDFLRYGINGINVKLSMIVVPIDFDMSILLLKAFNLFQEHSGFSHFKLKVVFLFSSHLIR